jgi:hypothetical protein
MTDERAARYSDLFGEQTDRTSDCAYCPICATIAVVRNARPEMVEHLAAAARELVVAAGLVVQEAERFVSSGDHEHGRHEPGGKLHRIDIQGGGASEADTAAEETRHSGSR